MDLTASLPLEILVAIGRVDPHSWRALLAVPDFARWTMTSHARQTLRDFLVCETIGTCTRYWLAGRLHNFDDLPAVTWTDNCFYSFVDNDFVKENNTEMNMGPGSEHGGSAWFRHGIDWRANDLPNVIHNNCYYEWTKNSESHRENDKPAMVSWDYKNLTWYKNAKEFRENGPFNIDAKKNKIQWNSFENEIGIKSITARYIKYQDKSIDKISIVYFAELMNYYLNSWKTTEPYVQF